MQGAVIKKTVKEHLFDIFEMAKLLAQQDYERDKPKTQKEIDMFKVINYVNNCSSKESFASTTIAFKNFIKSNMPSDEELAVFLSRCVKPEFHRQVYDLFEYFEIIVKHI